MKIKPFFGRTMIFAMSLGLGAQAAHAGYCYSTILPWNTGTSCNIGGGGVAYAQGWNLALESWGGGIASALALGYDSNFAVLANLPHFGGITWSNWWGIEDCPLCVSYDLQTWW
jgi:hypothetical protein